MVRLLQNASTQEGIDIHCNVNITEIEKRGRGVSIMTEDGRRFECDMVVHGAGRTANIEDLELDKANIAYTKKGITVDNRMATSNPGIYAVGDCVDAIQLARVADAQAHVAAANMIGTARGRNAATMDYSAVPAILFTFPQYGMVGATEETLKEKGIVYTKSFDKELAWPTYKRVGMTSAAYKVLVDEDGQFLGAHVLSDNATGLINSFALAMNNAISVQDLYQQSIMTPYPSRESDIIYMLKPLLAI
jgi:glutathione reductase (NADPH)